MQPLILPSELIAYSTTFQHSHGQLSTCNAEFQATIHAIQYTSITVNMQHNINYTISLPYHHHHHYHPLLSHSLYYTKSYMYIIIHYYYTALAGVFSQCPSPNQTCTFTANSPKQTQAE